MADRIEDTLMTLHRDTERVGLADSAEVRRRGDRRTRNQAIGSALGVAVLVSGVVGISGGLAGDRRSTNIPADPPTASSPEETPELAPEPLMPPSSVPKVGPYEAWQRSDDVDESLPRSQCVSSPTTWGATQTQAALYYSDLDAQVIEHVLVFPDVSAATAAVAGLVDELTRCPAGNLEDARVDTRLGTGLDMGNDPLQTARGSRLTTPKADAGIGYYEVGVVRYEQFVMVVQWNGMGNPVGDGEDDWIWTPQRLKNAFAWVVD